VAGVAPAGLLISWTFSIRSGATAFRQRTLPVRLSMPTVARRLLARSNSVRKTRSSQTTGDESPGPIAVFHDTFSAGPNVTGGVPSPSPEPFGPRNCGHQALPAGAIVADRLDSATRPRSAMAAARLMAHSSG
jgi:hypothetical protein